MTHRMLIVDDEKPVQIAIARLARLDLYHLESPCFADNGKDALRIIREIRPSLIFVDMNMPIMSGVEFLREASALGIHCAFIVISGYDDFSYAREAIHYGVTDYLLKPVAAEDLNNAIAKAMHLLYPEEDFSSENSTASPLSSQEVIALLKDTLETNYSRPFRLQDFAEEHFFSKEYLFRLFKNAYGEGPSEYLTGVRMRRAGDLLRDPDIKITDIAPRVGYTDTTYFSKAFKNFYNMTPSEYRRQF